MSPGEQAPTRRDRGRAVARLLVREPTALRIASHVVALTALWVVLARSVAVGQLLAGVLVALAALLVAPPGPGPRLLWRRLPRLVAHETASILSATLAVARGTLSPGRPEPARMDVHLPGAALVELNWIAVLITLTPGTFVIDVDGDGERLLVHVLDGTDREGVRDDILRLGDDVRHLFGLSSDRTLIVEKTDDLDHTSTHIDGDLQ